MRQWTDREGRKWTLDINVGSVRKVKSDTAVDLLDISETGLADKVGDPMQLCDILWSLVERQAAEKDITPESFGESLAGDCLEAAIVTLTEEIVDFFPSRRRKILKTLLDKSRAAESDMLDTALEKVESSEMEDQIRKMMETSR